MNGYREGCSVPAREQREGAITAGPTPRRWSRYRCAPTSVMHKAPGAHERLLTKSQFRQLLQEDRYRAALLVANATVEGGMNDGPAEVARLMANWIYNAFDLGDDELIVGLAENEFDRVIDDEPEPD